MKIRKRAAILLWSLWIMLSLGAESLNVATWNVEHLGSPGRGLGYRNLPLRSPRQLQKIAELIQEEDLQLLALQEIAIGYEADGLFRSEALDRICAGLGEQWEYRIAPPSGELPSPGDIHNMQNAYLWDSTRVKALRFFTLDLPNIETGGKNMFDRNPWLGWFEAIMEGKEGNDFLLINLHMASGQDNDENHMAAMIMVERGIYQALKVQDITESDRAVLGDFNDDPWAVNDRGNRRYSDLMYQYMKEKSFEDLVTEEIGFTRMNNDLSSKIDHVLVNRGLMRHIEEPLQSLKPEAAGLEEYQIWRETYSDHFPLKFKIEIRPDDDAD